MKRGLFLTVALLGLSGCCSTPQDPEDPDASKQAKQIEAWFELLHEGKDEQAFELFRNSQGTEDGAFTLERFRARVDKLGALRSVESIEWTRVHYIEQGNGEGPLAAVGKCLLEGGVEMEAQITDASGVHSFSCRWFPGEHGGVDRVQIDGKPLIPSYKFHVAASPPPETLTLIAPQLQVTTTDRRSPFALRLQAEADLSPGSVTVGLETLCKHGEHWFRRGFQIGPRQHQQGRLKIDSAAPLEPSAPSMCELRVQLMRDDTVEQVLCFDGRSTLDGPCPEQPSRHRVGPHPAAVTEVRHGDDGMSPLTVEAAVVLNDPAPLRSEQRHAQIGMRMKCADGSTDFDSRSISADAHQPGEHRRYLARYKSEKWPDGFVYPCDVGFEFLRWDAYDREMTVLRESCLTQDGVRDGRCDSGG